MQGSKAGRPSLTEDDIVERRTAAQAKRSMLELMKARGARMQGAVLLMTMDSGTVLSEFVGTSSNFDATEKELLVSYATTAARDEHMRRAKAAAAAAALAAGVAAAEDAAKRIGAGQDTAGEFAESIKAILTSVIHPSAPCVTTTRATKSRPPEHPAAPVSGPLEPKLKKPKTYNLVWDRFKGYYHRLDK